MSINIAHGTTTKPEATQALLLALQGLHEVDGQLFVGYPVLATPTYPLVIDALLATPTHGLIVFDLVQGQTPGDYEARQDTIANGLEAKLRTHTALMDRRQLTVPIHPITYGPAVYPASTKPDTLYPIANTYTLSQVLDNLPQTSLPSATYKHTLAVLENIAYLRQSPTSRSTTNTTSKGSILKRLEDSIATLDQQQSQAVIETVDGVQRIRGLAGSGKTIVLALKAAYLHTYHPDWHIAVTFNTRSLKAYFRRLINNFTIAQTGQEPDWDRIQILNAWGASGGPERTGLYYQYCLVNNTDYLSFNRARSLFGQEDAFSGACDAALDSTTASRHTFDAILVDEAQDLPASFLRLCYSLLNEPKRLIYAYDELQSLSGHSLPPPENIFGQESDGTPRVSFDRTGDTLLTPIQDVILPKCYRNSRPVLATAHALGFGIYRQPPPGEATGLIQMFDDPQLWEDVGYITPSSAPITEGKQVTLQRTPNTSPQFLEEHSPTKELITFHSFADAEDQAQWLAHSLKQNLTTDELNHTDIMVINLNPRTTRRNVGLPRAYLLDLGITSHLAGVDTDPDIFYHQNESSITFTGIHRAKGNEAGIVYIINAQESVAGRLNLATMRSELFTAITRSKAWVRVLGHGPAMEQLIEEAKQIYTHDFDLTFTYPTAEQREHLRIVHRDMTSKNLVLLDRSQRGLKELLERLESRDIVLQDLDSDLLAKLRGILDR